MEKSQQTNYLELVYGWKSEYQKIQDVEERKKVVCDKLRISFEHQKEQEKSKLFREDVLRFMETQNPLKSTLLITKQELLHEMFEKVREPLLQTKDEDKLLKNVKLKGDIDELCGRLVDDVERLFKEIYQDKTDEAKSESRKSLEQRLKKG